MNTAGPPRDVRPLPVEGGGAVASAASLGEVVPNVAGPPQDVRPLPVEGGGAVALATSPGEVVS